MGPKSLVKIRSVTSLILLPWTKVIWTNVAWANAFLTYMASVKDGPRNLPLKPGKNWCRNSSDILILTNVARSNVAWTNVTVTVDIC